MKRALSPSLLEWSGPSSPSSLSLSRPRVEPPRPISPSLLPRPPPKPPLPIKHLVAILIDTAPSGREPLFPEAERRTVAYVRRRGKRCEYRLSEVDSDGRIYADCNNIGCKRGCCLDMIQFAPPTNSKNHRRLPAFSAAMQSFSAAYGQGNLEEARVCRTKLEELRNGQCPSCQHPPGYLSPAQQTCKDEYNRMRKAACSANGGCANPNCVERGDQAWCVLQGDHLHTINDPDQAKRKTVALGRYVWWSWNGGVPAMRAEQAKGMQWICGFCHFLEPTGSQANRCSDPATMPEGKANGTPEEVKQYSAKHIAVIRYPKQQYVDKRKRSIGCCQRCERSDVEGQEWCFHFDHRDESTKMRGKETLAGESGGVSGLVGNHTQRAALHAPGVQKILDDEMEPKCDLLCVNCHHRKTWGYPPRVPDV